MTIERDFKGVWIPKEVWLDTRLNALDKVILVEIDSLDKGDDGCFASNQYIAEFCQCSETKISTSISKLIEYGYLYVLKFDGRVRRLKSRLSKFETLPIEKCEPAIQNLKHTNTNTNTNNNTTIKRFAPPMVDEVAAYCKERGNNVDAQHFVDYYTGNGWKVGRNPMKDWRAAVRTWERNGFSSNKGQARGANGILLDERKTDDLDGIL